MKNFSLNKRDFILTACGAVTVLPTVSVSAQSIVIQKQPVDLDLPELNLGVENDSEALFSPPISQPEESTQEGVEGSNSDSLSLTVEEDNQQNQNSSVPLSLVNQVSMITPQAGVINTKTTNITIGHHPEAKIEVTVNGKAIDNTINSYTHKDESQQLHTQIWYNVPLSEGENTITAQAQGGNPVSVKVIVEQQTAKISLNPVGEPSIPADGRSNIDFQGKITDEMVI